MLHFYQRGSVLKKKMLFWIAGIAVAIQFIRPDFHDQKVDATVALQADGQVRPILEKACYDCHSDETKYPWYSNVAPVSWFMANHIDHGRKAMNFSNWENIDTQTRIARLERAKHLLHIGLMPLGSYQWMHKGANLTPQQKETLAQFFDEQLKALKASEEQSVAKAGVLSNKRMG